MLGNHKFYSDKSVTPALYHVALIDYLQEWNLNKKMERLLKTVVLQKDGKKLSAIEPSQYAFRFRHFIEMNLFN
jgi:1-phosphatidylinositol-4-phosphate 5-kinase